MTMSARLKAVLDEKQIRYTLMSHSPAYTAQAAAAMMHVSGKDLAKTVVVLMGEQSALAVLPASHHVNLRKLGELAGAAVRLASEQEFIGLFPDCELGAMPPLGELYGLPVYVDQALAADQEIVFHAGTHREAIRMRYEDFAQLARPRVGAFAERG